MRTERRSLARARRLVPARVDLRRRRADAREGHVELGHRRGPLRRHRRRRPRGPGRGLRLRRPRLHRNHAHDVGGHACRGRDPSRHHRRRRPGRHLRRGPRRGPCVFSREPRELRRMINCRSRPCASLTTRRRQHLRDLWLLTEPGEILGPVEIPGASPALPPTQSRRGK